MVWEGTMTNLLSDADLAELTGSKKTRKMRLNGYEKTKNSTRIELKVLYVEHRTKH